MLVLIITIVVCNGLTLSPELLAAGHAPNALGAFGGKGKHGAGG